MRKPAEQIDMREVWNDPQEQPHQDSPGELLASIGIVQANLQLLARKVVRYDQELEKGDQVVERDQEWNELVQLARSLIQQEH